MKNKKLLLALSTVMLLLPACSSSSGPSLYAFENLHYQSSDSAMETFLNDYTHRHLRYDEDSIGTVFISHTTGFAKNWDTMGISWHNNRDNLYLEDRYENIASYLNNITQDELGMIYNTYNGKDSYFTEAGECCNQGWPFPYWKQSTNHYLDWGECSATNAMAFEYNGNREEDSGWVSANGDFDIEADNGYATFSCEGQTEFSFYKEDLSEIMQANGGIYTICAPFVEIDISFQSVNVEDYYVIYKTKKTGDVWLKSAQKTYATSRLTNLDSVNARQYLSLYLDDRWDDNVITEIGLGFQSKEGTTMNIVNGVLNYIRPNYDTRQSNATLQWLLALDNYVSYTNDLDFLRKIMPKARRAMLFLLHALKGEDGLVDVSYLYGHNGIGLEYDDNGEVILDCANGISNGWWDVSTNPELALEPNIYFYTACQAMAKFEKMVTDHALNVIGNTSVRNRDLNLDETVAYDYDSDYFTALAAKVKERIEKNVNPVLQEDGRYQNEGGFYYPETGRFVNGINEKTGEVQDYGNTAFNLQAVAAGLGTDEEQLSVMQWIDGQRIIPGDTSQGEDIYFYEFAPRSNTKEAVTSFNFSAYQCWWQIRAGESLYNLQVQDGGAALVFSYYDLVARANVLGAANAMKRLNAIKKWYNTILDSKYHGTGSDFYNDYYMHVEAENVKKNPDQEGYYVLQNSERDGAGSLGLDGEFLENVILCKAIPDAFFGFTYEDLTLNLTHDYSSSGYLQVDNCSFKDCTYSLYTDKNTIALKNVNGLVNHGQKISFFFPTEKKNPKVYLDGTRLAASDYTFENGTIELVTDYANHTLTVK